MNLVERKVSQEEMDEQIVVYTPRARTYQHQKEEPVRFDNFKAKGLQLRKFLKQNPEMVIRLLLIASVLAVIIACGITKHRTTERLNAVHKEELSAARFQTEQEVLARVKEEYGINAANAEMALMEDQAKTVAKVLYAMRNNRENGLHLSCWAIFDRVDHVRYSDDLYSVCSADQAFMGWSDDNPVLDELYQIALEEVQRWHRGVRPMDTAFVYLYWTPSEIYLMDDFGHRFYESDWANYLDAHAE